MTIAESTTFERGVVAKIIFDEDAESPAEWDNVGQIAYLERSRYVLGTEKVSQERMNEIRDGIADGSLIGLPIYAYVHSGVTIRAASSNVFSGFDPGEWDSGQSGFVYCTKEKAVKECGKKLCTPKVRELALRCLRAEVETFDQYLQGDVYGVVIEVDGTEVESCWGFFGLDYAREEAKQMGEHAVAAQAREAAEREHWNARDVTTSENNHA